MDAGDDPQPLLIRASGSDATALLAELGIVPPVPVVVIIGGAGKLDATESDGLGREAAAKRAAERKLIAAAMADALRPAVRAAGAVVITGGTDAGVMRIAGDALADVAAVLVGVAPRRMVSGPQPEASVEARHHSVVLTDGSRWGSETELLFELAEAVTASVAPGLVYLANGGDVSYEEATRFVRGGWSIATVAGSGGAADNLVKAVARQRDSRWGDLREADVEQLPHDAAEARQQLAWRLHDNELLKSAWSAYAAYDDASRDLKREAKRARTVFGAATFLLLGLVTFLVQAAVFRWVSQDGQHVDQLPHNLGRSTLAELLPAIRMAVIALPVGIAVAAAVATFSLSQQKWRAVRAAAETLKREIYRYRAHITASEPEARPRLVAMLTVVDDEALRGGVAISEQPTAIVRSRPRNVDPDEVDTLNAKIYMKRRVEQQLLWFRRTSLARTRRERWVVATAAFTAALATVLAGSKFAAWVALLVLAASAFSVARERRQTREEVRGYDRAVADVNAARVRWLQQSPEARAEPSALIELVRDIEAAFERESFTWSEVMRRAAQAEQLAPAPLAP